MNAQSSPSRRHLILACVLAGSFMTAVESTIVATAVPQIVSDVGGFKLYSWLFSIFLIGNAVTSVIYGKLADLYGRRPVLIIGILVFIIGSLLCGMAWSMLSLIAFRAVQGIGAGAIQPIGNTIVADLYPLEERGKPQGYIGAVWGASAIVGPVVGGFIVQHFAWAWIFWLNIPVGICTIIGLQLFMRENVVHRRHSIDFVGAALFSATVLALLLLFTARDGALAGPAANTLLATILAVGAMLFWLWERRAPEPMVSFALWSERVVASSNALTLLLGALLVGISSLVPIYAQGVLGQSAMVAGLALATFSVSWSAATLSTLSLVKRFGLTATLRAGGLFSAVGGLLFTTWGSTPDVWSIARVVCSDGLVGFGIGIVSMTTLALVQERVDWSSRGSATASMILARNVGGTIGVALLGALLNYGLAGDAAGGMDAVRALIDRPAGAGAMTSDLSKNLFGALSLAFWAIAAFGVLALVGGFFVPTRNTNLFEEPGKRRERK